MIPPPIPFSDRQTAGRSLARELQEFRGLKNAVILGLVRGGVVVGSAIAEELRLPLYPYTVRKIGHPAHREYGVGAIAEGGATFIDDAGMRKMGLSWEDIEPVIDEETAELARRKKAYLTEARPPLVGKSVILTDDGAATGATMFAAIADVRKAGASEVTVALPVCPPDVKAKLAERADKVVILATPADFEAVGKWYAEFPQVEDEEVIAMLQTRGQ